LPAVLPFTAAAHMQRLSPFTILEVPDAAGPTAVYLEWRWPIPGRNTTGCGSPDHTCDLHRRDKVVTRYTP
jgi:hypothetical protein